MSIPKTIYQTYKNCKLPLITKWHIYRLKKRNPNYDYQFYDDSMAEDFIKQEFDTEIFDLFQRIQIGAAKADFFRYAILYKRGGIYLDIDSLFKAGIDDILLLDDCAVISPASHKKNFVQWALFFEAGHPFLEKTMELMIDNLKENKYPYNVHRMTGPTVYTEAIFSCLEEQPNIKYRQLEADYENKLKFSYSMSKFFLYGVRRKNHWKKISKEKTVLK